MQQHHFLYLNLTKNDTEHAILNEQISLYRSYGITQHVIIYNVSLFVGAIFWQTNTTEEEVFHLAIDQMNNDSAILPNYYINSTVLYTNMLGTFDNIQAGKLYVQ